MKPSGSPCPLDQISVISLKRCPYLRTYLTEIIQTSWSSGAVPSEWKKACTILIHKKDETDNPANFRPITLESVPLKVFTSCLRNKIFYFLSENNLLYVTLTTLFRHAKTFVDGEYVHNRNAPSVSTLNLYYTWLLDVSPTSIVLRGGTILF